MGVVDTELCIRSLAMKSTVSALIICCLGLATAAKVCDPSYSAVGDKCYSVPGLPIQISFWWASEYCSSLTGDLFHVESIDEWRQLNTFLDGNQRSGTPWNMGGSFDWRRTGRVGRGIQNRIAQQFRREIVFGRRVPTGFGSLPIRRLSVQQRIRHRLRGQILPIKSVFNK